MSGAASMVMRARVPVTATRSLLQCHSARFARQQHIIAHSPSAHLAIRQPSRAFHASPRSSLASSVRLQARLPPPASSSAPSSDGEPDPGGKPIPTDGSYRTVYDDFNNITSSPEDDAILNVRSMGEANFTLTDGLVCYTPIILLQRNALLWDAPPLATTAAGEEAVVMPNGVGWEAWTDDVWSVFEVASPRPEIVIFGTGKTVLPPPAKVRQYLNRLGIQIEAHSTRNACSTYNMLIDEGRVVAAALLPNVRTPTRRTRT